MEREDIEKLITQFETAIQVVKKSKREDFVSNLKKIHCHSGICYLCDKLGIYCDLDFNLVCNCKGHKDEPAFIAKIPQSCKTKAEAIRTIEFRINFLKSIL